MKTVLITGANRGIGWGFTQHYLALGYQVIACYRQTQQSQQLLELNHPNLMPRNLDITKEAEVEQLAIELRQTPIDILIQNAGMYGPRQSVLGKLPTPDWLDIFATNTIAPLKLIEKFWPMVALSQEKKIAVISSKMGSIADNSSGGSYLYRTSKAALNAGIRSLAIDLHSQSVSVFALHPGWVKTDMGGANALLTVSESVENMVQCINMKSIKDSGQFFNYDGTMIPW